MTRTQLLMILTSLIVVLFLSLPAESWIAYHSYHYGAYGGTAAWGHWGGAYHGAYYRRPAPWYGSSGSATTARGGSASWGGWLGLRLNRLRWLCLVEGIAYNPFHTTAMCSPTRAALLTGRNH